VARYLSPEWVYAFDEALGALDLSTAVAAAGVGSLAAAEGTFSVAQVVRGVPADLAGEAGQTRLVLMVQSGRVRLLLDPDMSLPATATIVLGYADALALSLGALDPADALAAGRVRVHGDLAALVAGQEILAYAASQLGPALQELTDPIDPAAPTN
jgi:hypothetical protein